MADLGKSPGNSGLGADQWEILNLLHTIKNGGIAHEIYKSPIGKQLKKQKW
jgi:hypothetical protein